MDSQPRNILLVEDDPDIREAVADLLSDAGYRVTGVENGLQAMSALRAAVAAHAPHDVIVLDLMMPVMDGWEFRLEQKRDPQLARIPVLVITADDSPKAGAIDADYFIRKPFDVRELQRGVEAILLATERRAQQARSAQTERLASLGLLAAGVSHEINNPLSYVVTNLEYLAEEVRRLEKDLPPGRTAEMTRAISEARDGAARVQRIVRSLSTFSRVEDERRKPVDPQHTLELSINMAANQIRHRGKLARDYGPVPAVHADEAQLAQVFINLLVNAAQALDEARAELNRIGVKTATAANGWALIEISDNGAGILPNDLPRVFDPFFSTKPIGEGSGLGLYTSYGIISALGGRIDVESEPNRGTTVRVHLPPSAAPAEAPRPIGTVKTPPPVGRARVLVIDDEPLICATLRRTLAGQHEVSTLTSAVEALALLEKGERFDIVFCDLMMPAMSGMDLYEHLRTSAPEVLPSIVFLTGGAFTPRAKAFLDSVPNSHVEKPFKIDELRAFVRARLDRS